VPVIKLNQVSKSLRGIPVFDSVSLEFESGRAYGIVGPNGSGKSVLFKLICGFMLPDSGTIEIDKAYKPDGATFPLDFGIIVDRPGYHPDLTAIDNLKRLAAIRRIIGQPEIIAALEAVGLDPRTRQKARNFSLGMKQKLALAQAIMENQTVLLLDEPFNALDADSVTRVRNLLLEAKAAGKTIIFTSHNASDIEVLADTVYQINNRTLELVA